MLAVRQPNCDVALARAGHLAVDESDRLLAAGLLVLDEEKNPIAPPPGTPRSSRLAAAS